MSKKIIQLGPKDQFYLDELGAPLISGGLIAGIVSLAAAVGLGAAMNDGWRQFLFSYLTAWLLFFIISASSLFFVLGHHLFRASWSVVVRRLAEAMSCNFIPLLVLTIPLLLGFHTIFSTAPSSVYGSWLLATAVTPACVFTHTIGCTCQKISR